MQGRPSTARSSTCTGLSIILAWLPLTFLLSSHREWEREGQGGGNIGAREKVLGNSKNQKKGPITITPMLIPTPYPTPPTPLNPTFLTPPKPKQPGRGGQGKNKGKGKREEKGNLKHPPHKICFGNPREKKVKGNRAQHTGGTKRKRKKKITLLRRPKSERREG